MPTLVMALVPVESSVPELPSVPPLMVALARSSVEPEPTVTVPAPVLVTVRVVSFSVRIVDRLQRPGIGRWGRW